MTTASFSTQYCPHTHTAPAPVPYKVVHGKGCHGYIHMDGLGKNGIRGGQYKLEQCADAVRELNGHDGCNGKFFFYESAGYCNCPTDDCNTSPNGNAGGPGQLYEFTDGMHDSASRT